MARDAFERLLGSVKDVMARHIASYQSADQIVAAQVGCNAGMCLLNGVTMCTGTGSG